MAEAACLTASAYRPRRARDSSLYRLAETHDETFKQLYDERFAERYGAWRAVVERTLFAFLDCGIEERGFARVRCDTCRREFRVALSCKTRGFCLSCHAKRAVLWAEWLVAEVLAPVSHHQWVFTVPKRLRLFFLYDRRLLGALARCAWETVRELYGAGLEDRHAAPGMVVSIQTYGDLANWQPHLHALVSGGAFDREGEFTPLALPPAGVAEELFRRRVIRMLVRRGRLEEDAAAGLLSWKHSGFSVHHAIRVDHWDTEGVLRLCRYLVHPPIALGRLQYDGTRATYSGRRVHPLTGEASVTLDPLEMLARLCQHIPPPGMHLTRLYGAYANRTRGARARRMAGAGKKPASPRSEADTPAPTQRERRRPPASDAPPERPRGPRCGGFAALLRPAGAPGEAHRQGVRGRPAALPLRGDDAGHRVHPRPGGDPEDPAAPAAARAARPRSAARLRSLTRNAVPRRLRGRLRVAVCVCGGGHAPTTYPGSAHPRPARWGVPPAERAREEPANLGGGDRRPRRPLRTAPVAGCVMEFPTLSGTGASSSG